MKHTTLTEAQKTYIVAVRTVAVATVLAVMLSVVRAQYVLWMEWAWMQ